MKSLLLAALFLASSSHYPSSSAARVPATVEVDLLFPRNESYAPTAYFPLVFAIRNASAAWPWGLRFDASVRSESDPDSFDFFHLPTTDGRVFTSGDAPADPFFFIVSTTLTNATAADTFSVAWKAAMEHDCAADGRPSRSDGYFSGRRALGFTTRPGAPLPDVEAAVKACPSVLARGPLAYSVQEVAGACPMVANTTPPADPCALRPFAERIATNASRVVLEAAGCKEGTWQNITTACVSDASRQYRRGSSWHWMALMAGLGLLAYL